MSEVEAVRDFRDRAVEALERRWRHEPKHRPALRIAVRTLLHLPIRQKEDKS